MIATASSMHRRISVLTPTARVDLVVPGHLPVAELMPAVTELARVGAETDGADWQLGRVGRAALSPEQSLDAAGVRDGELLDLRPSWMPVVGPVYDEITDVVAAVAAERMGRTAMERRRAVLPAAGIVLAGAAAWTWWHRAANAGTAAALTAVLLVAAVVAARRRRRVVAAGLGTASIAFAAAAVAGAVPVGIDAWVVAAAVTMVGAPLMALAIRTGLTVFTALTTAGVVGVAGSVAVRAFSFTIGESAVAVAVLGVAILPVVPRWSARLAGLRRRGGAYGADGVAPAGAALDGMLAAARRALAVAVGLDAAVACLVTVAALVLARTGEPWSVSLAGIVLILLLLRSRVVDVPEQAMALGVPAAVGLIAGAALLMQRLPPVADAWVPVGVVAIALAALVFGCSEPGRSTSPAAQRAGRLIEGALVLAVVPIAVAAVQGYSRLRHL